MRLLLRWANRRIDKTLLKQIGKDHARNMDAAMLRQQEELAGILSKEFRKHPYGTMERVVLYDIWNKVRLHRTERY